MLTASVIETASGDVIGGAVETVTDSTDVLAAITRLSDRVRRAIGESTASIQSAGSLWSLTTSSLPALRKHVAASRAYWRGDFQTAATLLTEATTLDPEFAHAHLLLWVALEGAGAERGRALRSLVRAYELRDHLTERERYAVEGNYFLSIVGDVPKSIVAFRRHIDALKQLRAGEPGWYSTLGNALSMSGDLAEAEGVLQDGRLRHMTVANQAGLISVLYAEHKDEEIPAVLGELAHRYPTHPTVGLVRVRLLADSGHYEAAHALAANTGTSPANRLKLQAEMDAVLGRIGEAVGHLKELRDNMLARGQLGPAVEIAVTIGRLRALSGDSARATAEVAELLAQHPLDSVDAMSRPYLTLAAFDGEIGQSQRARAWLAAYEREVPREFRGPDQSMLHRARAAVHRGEGSPAEALAELQTAGRFPAARTTLVDERIGWRDHPALARVYDALGSSDSAIAVYERYVGARSLSRTTLDAFELGHALERLGALYEKRGDHVRAGEYYARWADLWRGADAPLRRRAMAAARAAGR
jgi:tetratricopeptide (TPR) repeat protein